MKYFAVHQLPCYRPGWKGVWDHFLAVLWGVPVKFIVTPHRLAFNLKTPPGVRLTQVETFITDINLTEQAQATVAKAVKDHGLYL